ncbi:MAG: RNA polymerase sigma factor RpoD/SigA [Bacteroidota bacterium]|nr:RNA polymerase sigma factor RpoD/SigA [Bacteroidota bacterium]
MRALNISPSYTNHDDDSLGRYFNDIKKIGLLSAAEEQELIHKIKGGDTAALNRLVTSNLRFVISVAKRYQNRGVSISDLINEGNVGLIKAAAKFDETQGCRFISYAVWWIRQAIQIAVTEQSRIVHLPYGFATLMGKFNKGKATLEQNFTREPSVEEVAEYLNVDIAKMEELMFFSVHEVSLDKPVNNESGSTLHDLISAKDYAIDQTMQKEAQQHAVSNSLSILNAREREIITLYFGLNLTVPLPVDEIARRLNITVVCIRRMKDKALLRLKNSSYGPLLKSCLN